MVPWWFAKICDLLVDHVVFKSMVCLKMRTCHDQSLTRLDLSLLFTVCTGTENPIQNLLVKVACKTMAVDDIRDDLGGRNDRIAALSLLASGKVPSWYMRRKPNSNVTANETPSTVVATKYDKDPSGPINRNCRIAILLFLLASAIKVMLFPAYRSTDFLVHRHWKALTRHAPRQSWYYHDEISSHTLDYPPLFALFESIWSNAVFPLWVQCGFVDETCLSLVPDHQVIITDSCVAFMRSTVIVSDVVWGMAAWIVSRHDLSMYAILMFHPSLYFLDHIHFQYNGFLLGILLLSIHAVQHKRDCAAAVLMGTLISLKHIYVTCGLWFAVLWCKRYRRQPLRLIYIGLCGVTPIVLAVVATIDTDAPQDWVKQVLSRLFPFHRGLLHDYWAGNVWAFYAAADKILAKLIHIRLPLDVPPFITIAATLLLQLPSLIRVNDANIWSSFTLMALACFLTQYHGHEKAILTALMPAIVNHNADATFHAAALVSLFPLLFESNELCFKLVSTVLLLAVVSCKSGMDERSQRYKLVRPIVLLMLLVAVLQLEVLPTIGRYEFLKLAVVSLSCGVIFIHEYWKLVSSNATMK